MNPEFACGQLLFVLKQLKLNYMTRLYALGVPPLAKQIQQNT